MKAVSIKETQKEIVEAQIKVSILKVWIRTLPNTSFVWTYAKLLFLQIFHYIN